MGSVGLGLIALCLIAGTRSSEIDRHRQALSRLRFPSNPTSLRGYFSAGYILWNLQGRHSFDQVLKRRDLHTKSLIALGYLQQRSFPLEHQDANGNWVPQLNSIIRQDGRLNEPLAS